LGVALQLVPISPGTKIRWEQIQREQGWIGARTFGLQMSLRSNRLRFEGNKPGLLPEGKYQASIFLGGYRFHTRVYDFEIPKDGTAVIVAAEKADKRRVQLDRKISDFDDDTRRIINASILDGVALAEWLTQDHRRDSRKACILNILAKLRTPVGSLAPLSKGVTRLIFADVDRIYAELEPRFAGRLMLAAGDFEEDAVIHSTHLRLLRFVKDGTSSELHSLREKTEKLSMQLALAVPPDAEAPQFADVDIDLGNPFTTPLGFVIHVGELIDPGKTDHLALCKRLQGTRCKEFLYYRVAEESDSSAAKSGV
jgi:hypothetical protein